jgi:hypothetical protein
MRPSTACYFDTFVVGGQPRERLYPGPAATRALTPAGQAGNYPVLLVDGVVGGCGTSGARAEGWPSPWSRWVCADRDPTQATGGRPERGQPARPRQDRGRPDQQATTEHGAPQLLRQPVRPSI